MCIESTVLHNSCTIRLYIGNLSSYRSCTEKQRGVQIMCIEYRYGCTGIILKESYIRCDPADCSRRAKLNTNHRQKSSCNAPKSPKEIPTLEQFITYPFLTFHFGIKRSLQTLPTETETDVQIVIIKTSISFVEITVLMNLLYDQQEKSAMKCSQIKGGVNHCLGEYFPWWGIHCILYNIINVK